MVLVNWFTKESMKNKQRRIFLVCLILSGIFKGFGNFLCEMNKHQLLIIKGNYDNFPARPPIFSFFDTKGSTDIDISTSYLIFSESVSLCDSKG